MTTLRRCLLPLAIAALVLALTAPATAAAASPRFPTQSLGNRGTDVKAIQWLLNERGYPVAVDGIFGATTVDAVKAHQAAAGLPANGIVDDATWTKLIVRVSLGSTGPAVSAVQRELHAKRHLDPPIDGVFGASTRTAVRAFQKHEGLAITGVVTARPGAGSSGTSSCRRSTRPRSATTASATARRTGRRARRPTSWRRRRASSPGKGHGRVAVGRRRLEHGGDIVGHETHERGMDVDLRLMRKGKDQCRWGGTYRAATYDRAATRALVKAIRATAPGHVKLIYFNDPVLVRRA